MKENNPKCYGLWCLFIICLLIIIPFYTSCERPGDGDDNNTQDDNGTETFTIGDVSLTASTTETGGSQTVVVTDDDGNAVVSAVATISEAMLTLPDSSKHLITFDEPLSSLPAAFELNRAAVFIAYQIVSNIGDGSVAMRRDNPGCDLFYDYQCMLGCCADHDFCFDENNCTFYSWSLIYDSVPECRNCNDIAFACIIRSCYKGQTPKDQGTCYDNRCNMFYDCDSGYCDCTSPCALEICDNKKDDDGDTFEDCDDADCSPHSACIEICDNNKDDDGDYLVDCDDANCAGHAACSSSSSSSSTGSSSSTSTSSSSTGSSSSTSSGAQQELRWVLNATKANPENAPTSFAGGANGYPEGWYSDPRYEGKTQNFTITENSISMQDREVDNGVEYHNITLTSTFDTPPATLTPNETLAFTVNFSHSGTVTTGGGAGFTFISLVNGYWNGNGYCYTPWSSNCQDDPSTTFNISIPDAYENSEFKLGVGWLNCPACLVVWEYKAEY